MTKRKTFDDVVTWLAREIMIIGTLIGLIMVGSLGLLMLRDAYRSLGNVF